MKIYIIPAIIAGMLLVFCSSVPLYAQENHDLRPAVEVGGMYALMRPSVIGEFDRSRWLTTVQIHIPVSQELSVAAGYGFGGILYGPSGHTFTHGPLAGMRYTLVSGSGLWSDGLFVSYGMSVEWLAAHRKSPVTGTIVSVGHPLTFGTRYAMINELTASALFAEAVQLQLGFRNSMRMAW